MASRRSIGPVVRILICGGTIGMVTGLVVFVVFVGTAAHCGSNNLSQITACANGNAGLHAGFGVLVFGALLLLSGAVVAVRRDARRRSVESEQPSFRGPSP